MEVPRFQTAAQVFEAFPTARADMVAGPTDEPPLLFGHRLVGSPSPEDAISFCAYMLDRRRAVWWAGQCARFLGSPVDRDEEVALLTAEAWVKDPEEHRRRAALTLGLNGNHELPGVWIALAAGGAGGTLIVSADQAQGPPVPPHMCAKAARAAVLIAIARAPINERGRRIEECFAICRRIFEPDADSAGLQQGSQRLSLR